MSEPPNQMVKTKDSWEHTGFQTIERCGKFVLFVIMRFWRACSAAMLTLLLLYWLYGGVVSFLLLTAAVLGAAYHYQDSLLYFPEQPLSSRVFVQNPSALGLPYENLFLPTPDGVRINAVFIKQTAYLESTAPTLVFFHGNAGNIGHRLVNARELYSRCGCNILLVEYRGYGKSLGWPSEQGFELDAETALNYVLGRTDINTNKIVVFGRSLGGAVAIGLASNPVFADKLHALLLENTFTSIPHMANQMVGGLGKLPYFCYRNKFNSIQRICRATVPTLFLSGVADQLIPPRMMTALYKVSASSMKKIECFEGGTHNDTWQCYGYFDAIARFLQEVQRARDAGVIATPVSADKGHMASGSCKSGVKSLHGHEMQDV